MLLKFHGNVEKKKRAREMQANFNQYTAQQMDNEERNVQTIRRR